MVNYNIILESINYIEENSGEDITLEQIAEHIHYSKYHFARLFKEIAGENVGDYQIKRKLTLAATELLDGNRGILDIALEFGYHSQEAFTRIFKTYFGVTPKAYRDERIPYHNLYKYRITKLDLSKLIPEKTMHYSVVHIDEFQIVGQYYYGDNKKHDVARVFNQLVKKLPMKDIYNQFDGFYGLEYCDDINLRQEDFHFIAGINCRYLCKEQKNLRKETIPENDYAVFELTPIIEKIPAQVHNFYLGMISDNQYKLSGNYAFEYYPSDFIPNRKDKKAYLYLPVTKTAR